MSHRSEKGLDTSPPNYPLEKLNKALFTQVVNGVFITNTQGRYIEVNPSGCEILGYTREEILTFTMEDLILAEDPKCSELSLEDLSDGQTMHIECHLRHKNGRLLPVEIRVQMLTDGCFLNIVRDISERKRVEEQLRESNERFRLLAESSLTGIYLIQENLFRYVNPALAHMFGYKVEEVTDKLGPIDLSTNK